MCIEYYYNAIRSVHLEREDIIGETMRDNRALLMEMLSVNTVTAAPRRTQIENIFTQLTDQ